MDKSRTLIAAIITVRQYTRRHSHPIQVAYKEYDAIAYDPRYVRMVRINGSRVDVIPKNGGER